MTEYYVYIMTSRSGTLYAGMTNDLAQRVAEHKQGLGFKFTTDYRIDQLVHYEVFSDVREAFSREKEIKGWSRAKQIALVDSANPGWNDLAEEWLAVEA